MIGKLSIFARSIWVTLCVLIIACILFDSFKLSVTMRSFKLHSEPYFSIHSGKSFAFQEFKLIDQVRFRQRYEQYFNSQNELFVMNDINGTGSASQSLNYYKDIHNLQVLDEMFLFILFPRVQPSPEKMSVLVTLFDLNATELTVFELYNSYHDLQPSDAYDLLQRVQPVHWILEFPNKDSGKELEKIMPQIESTSKALVTFLNIFNPGPAKTEKLTKRLEGVFTDYFAGVESSKVEWQFGTIEGEANSRILMVHLVFFVLYLLIYFPLLMMTGHLVVKGEELNFNFNSVFILMVCAIIFHLSSIMDMTQLEKSAELNLAQTISKTYPRLQTYVPALDISLGVSLVNCFQSVLLFGVTVFVFISELVYHQLCKSQRPNDVSVFELLVL